MSALRGGLNRAANTFCELLSWGLIEQGLSRPFIELPFDRAELGLAMQGQCPAEDTGAAIYSCFRLTRAARAARVTEIDVDLGGQCQATDDRQAPCLCPKSATGKVRWAIAAIA